MSKLRIGFVGVGVMGQCAHLRNFVNTPDCEVVAIAELRENLARKVADHYGIPKVYKNHKELIKNEKLDGIVASQHYHTHGVLVPELYQAGSVVFTEKPLARSVQAGERIISARQKSGVKHLVGYNKRSDPATMCARKEIETLKANGRLGNLRYVRIIIPPGDWIAEGFTNLINTKEKIPDLPMDPLPADMDEETGNQYDAFVNYYIHQVNLMRHLLGENYRMAYADPSGVLMVIESESGIPGTIEMAPYHTTMDWQESALVAFEKGYIRLELPAPIAVNRPGRVTILRDPGNGERPETIVPRLPWIDSMRQQAINVIRALKGEATPLCEAEEALRDLKIAKDYIGMLLDSVKKGR